MELELKKSGAKSSNDTDGNGHLVTIDKLEKELEKVKEELAEAKEKLGILSSSNLNRLVEVATHRDRVRDLERDLEEVRWFLFCFGLVFLVFLVFLVSISSYLACYGFFFSFVAGGEIE